MTKIKRIEWHGGSSAHGQRRDHQGAPRSQRERVEASLARDGSARTRWDERARVEYDSPRR